MTTKTEPDLAVKLEPGVVVKFEPPSPAFAPLSPADTINIDRLTIHDKHPTLEAMVDIQHSLGSCIEGMKQLQGQTLKHGNRDYKALCAVHHNVTLQIRQLERLCAKVTP